MHQTLTCVVIHCMTNKGMTNGRIPIADMLTSPAKFGIASYKVEGGEATIYISISPLRFRPNTGYLI